MSRRFLAIPNRVRAFLDQLRGMLAYHRGRLPEARERLLAAISREANLYHARLYLGRVFACEGAFARAAEEFRVASRLRSSAFFRHRAELECVLARVPPAENVATASRRQDPDRAARSERRETVEAPGPSRAQPLGTVTTRSGASDPDPAVTPAKPPVPAGVTHDDFSSEAERRRFRRLPPLHPLEIRVTDWDDIGRRLLMPDPRRRGPAA